MMKEIEYSEIDNKKLKQRYVIVDLRSPSEYEKFTIPEAINIPIFDDYERHIVGKTYKCESEEKAKEIGVEIVSKKLPYLYKKIRELEKQHSTVIIFCEKGGMRSSILGALLYSLGVRVYKIKNGYKGYRKYINRMLKEEVNKKELIVLHGNTGVGKTKILNYIDEIEGNVIDLEGFANHRGSFFGSLGLGEPYTNKQFESLLYNKLKSIDKKYIFVEAESKRIGKVMINDDFFEKMKSGIHLNIEASMDIRIKNILSDYIYNKEEVISILEKLRRYISNEKVNEFILLAEKEQYEKLIELLMINYYDPMYKKKDREYLKTFNNYNEKETALELLEWIKKTDKEK